MSEVACVHCAAGLEPVKMKRQWVLHFPETGRIVVCEDATLKPLS